MADNRWNQARAALINSPDFDALPVEEKRIALQHLKARLSEPVTVETKAPNLSAIGSEAKQANRKVETPKPLRAAEQPLPQRPRPAGPVAANPATPGPVGNALLKGYSSLQAVQAPASQGRPILPPEMTQAINPVGDNPLRVLSEGLPLVEQLTPRIALGATPLGVAGPLLADAAMRGSQYGAAVSQGQMTQDQARNLYAADLATNALQLPIGAVLPGTSLLQSATRNLAQTEIPAQADEGLTGRRLSGQEALLNTALGAGLDVATGRTPTLPNMEPVKQAINDLVAPPRMAQAGSAFADDASFGGVFKKGDEPPTGGAPQVDPNSPPPRPPGSATAAGSMPDGPNTQLADKLISNAEAQARGETLPDLPRGAEGIPSDPNFQLANRTVDEPTQRVMAETAKAYEDHIQDRRRGIIPREQTKQQADLLGMTDKQLQARMKGQAFNAEQLQAALDLTEKSATQTKSMADQLAALKADGKLTDADRLAFVEAVQNHAMNQAEFSGATAEVARALGVLRAANNAKRQGEFIKKALDQFGGSEHVDDLIEVIAKTDPENLPRALNKIQDPSWLEMLSTLRKAGLMSGPKTAVKNVLSTGSNVLVQQEISQAIAGTLDWAHAAITGKDRTTYGASIPAMIRAGREAITKGGKEARDILKYGATPEQLLKGETSRELKLTRSPKLNAVINMPFRVAGAGDAVMKAYVNRRYIEGMARVAAVNEAKAAKAAGQAPVNIKARTRELVENPTPVMAAEAIAEADYQTFNAANLIADKLAAAKKVGKNTGAGQTINFVIDQILPFVRVPINYYSSQIVDMTGLGPLVRALYSDRAKGIAKAGSVGEGWKALTSSFSNAERRSIYRAVGMGAVGTAQIELGRYLARQGLATGTSFSDKGDKGRDDATGIPRGAVNLKAFGGPDKWVVSSWMAPLITMGAAFEEAGSASDNPLTNKAKQLLVGGAVVLDHPVLKGMKDTVDALKNPVSAGEHWIGAQAGSFVPSILSDVAGLMDDKRRQTESPMDSMKARIPGLRNTLPEKTDPFGQTTPQQTNFAFDPFQTRSDRTSNPVMAELARLKADVTYPADKLEPVGKDGEKVTMQLTAEQQNAIRAKFGEVALPVMAQLMAGSAYQQLSDDDKRDAVEHLMTTIKSRIRKAVTGQATAALQSAQ